MAPSAPGQRLLLRGEPASPPGPEGGRDGQRIRARRCLPRRQRPRSAGAWFPEAAARTTRGARVSLLPRHDRAGSRRPPWHPGGHGQVSAALRVGRAAGRSGGRRAGPRRGRGASSMSYTSTQEFDRAMEAFLEPGPDQLSARLAMSIADAVRVTPRQRLSWWDQPAGRRAAAIVLLAALIGVMAYAFAVAIGPT